MDNFNFNPCLKAVNKVQFRPTEYRKAQALELLWEAIEYVESLESPTPKSKEDTPKPQRKASPKRSKVKVKKATPSQRVADRQERQFHGKADSPVKPQKKARKASVAKARKSALQVSEATGAAARAKAKQLACAKAEAKELQKQLEATMEKLASLL
jgi:outer membrane biosynthesis protein TonB